jgi:hypothetical protein
MATSRPLGTPPPLEAELFDKKTGRSLQTSKSFPASQSKTPHEIHARELYLARMVPSCCHAQIEGLYALIWKAS